MMPYKPIFRSRRPKVFILIHHCNEELSLLYVVSNFLKLSNDIFSSDLFRASFVVYISNLREIRITNIAQIIEESL